MKTLIQMSDLGKRTSSGEQIIYYNFLVLLNGPVSQIKLPKGKVLMSYPFPIILYHSVFSVFIAENE